MTFRFRFNQLHSVLEGVLEWTKFIRVVQSGNWKWAMRMEILWGMKVDLSHGLFEIQSGNYKRAIKVELLLGG